jgi:hypothetical protein
MKESSRRARRIAGLKPLLAAWLGFATLSCEAQVCKPYSCSSTASLNGTIEVPDDTSAVDVTFCNKLGCFEGLIDVEQLRETECASGPLADFHASVCATRTASSTLELEASLTGEDTGSVPPDGESYTLKVVDHDSERVLVDEERKADYDALPNQDGCHHCWQTQMTL